MVCCTYLYRLVLGQSQIQLLHQYVANILSHLYRKKGYPAITDANLVLGRILPEFFPSIFGEDEKQPLDAQASKDALQKIAEQVNEQSKAAGQPEKSVEEVWKLYLNVSASAVLFCKALWEVLQ